MYAWWQAFRKTPWPEANPVGRTFRFTNEAYRVIGVAREIHLPTIETRLDVPEFYHPHTSTASSPMVSLRCEAACPDPAVPPRGWIR